MDLKMDNIMYMIYKIINNDDNKSLVNNITCFYNISCFVIFIFFLLSYT